MSHTSRVFRPMVMGIALFSSVSLSGADPFCGPGKRVGAENDGPGMSWVCIPEEPGRRRTASPEPASPNNVAAAIQLGVGVAGIIGALATHMEATDNVGRAEADRKGAGTHSREYNRKALLAMQQGSFMRAALSFDIAAKYADEAGNFREHEINRKNASLARAQDHLRQGMMLEKMNKPAAASQEYLRAKYFADMSDARELSTKIVSYNDRLAGSAPGRAKPSTAYCRHVNGKLICQ